MFIDVPDESALEEEAADWYAKQRGSWGYLPNYAHVFVARPDVGRAWNTLNGTIKSHMDQRRYELATIAAARVYRSTYCLAAHSKFLRDECGDDATMRAVAADPSGAGLDPTDRAVIDFATQVARDASLVTAADVQRLRDQGLDDPAIVDVALAAAARGFFAKVVDALGAEPDAQLGDTFDPEVRQQLIVGRPIAEA